MKKVLIFILAAGMLYACGRAPEASQEVSDVADTASVGTTTAETLVPEETETPPAEITTEEFYENYEPQPYVSIDFHGDGVTEYLLDSEIAFVYWTSANTQPMKLTLHDVKSEVVDETGLLNSGRVTLPNGTECKYISDETGLTLIHPDGRRQEFEIQY